MGSGIRLGEMAASLSLASDLARGQPREHGLGVGVLAVALGGELGLDEVELTRVWYGALLRHVGCTADNHVIAALLGDEIRFASGAARIDVTQARSMVSYLTRHLLRDAGPRQAAARLARLAAAPRAMREAAGAVCEVAEGIAEQLGLGAELVRDVGLGSERWDGRGYLRRAAGEVIPRPVRVVQVAETARTHVLLDGPDAALAVLAERAGGALDPQVVRAFRRRAAALFSVVRAPSLWETALACEPGARPELTGARLDTALATLAQFVDLKSPFTSGHSVGVAKLAGAAAHRAGLPALDCDQVRRAGLVHDLGRVGISSTVWEKRGPLDADERERVRLHAYHTERLLAAGSPPLATLGRLGSLHHERVDGSGYHRGAAAAALTPVARILAAADAFHAMTEPRPHRPALPLDVAVSTMRAEVRAGRLDGDAADAVLVAAGAAAGRRPQLVAGLTAREVQVLRLIARGRTKRDIAADLSIAPKTADAHIQHVYTKIGVSTRAAAALFAMRHDLLEPDADSH